MLSVAGVDAVVVVVDEVADPSTITSAATEDEVEVGATAAEVVGVTAVEVVEATAVEVAVAISMGTIVGTRDGVEDEVLLRGTIVGMMDGVEDEVLLQTTVDPLVITIARHQIIDHTSRIILTRMADRVAVAGVGLVLVLALTLVVQMNLGAAQDNTNTNQGTIGTTRVDAITEIGTRLAVIDITAIPRDATITTGNQIETIGVMTETDEIATSRVIAQGGTIGRKTVEGTRVDTNMIVKGAEIDRETIGGIGIGIGTMIVLKRKAGIGVDIRIAVTTITGSGTNIMLKIKAGIGMMIMLKRKAGTGIGTMIVLKGKAGIAIDTRIAIRTITAMTEEAVRVSAVSTRKVTGVPTKEEADRITAVGTMITVMTEKAVPASTVSTGRVTGVPTKKGAVRTIRLTMKSLDGGAEIKMKVEDVKMEVAKTKTKTKNGTESTTNITSGIGGRKATLTNEETTIAAIKSGIVTAGVVEARMACMCLLM
jgi:hypothetical protein